MKIVVDRERTFVKKKKAWMIEFFSKSDVAYTNPGRTDVCMGKVNDKRKYLPHPHYYGL